MFNDLPVQLVQLEPCIHSPNNQQYQCDHWLQPNEAAETHSEFDVNYVTYSLIMCVINDPYNLHNHNNHIWLCTFPPVFSQLMSVQLQQQHGWDSSHYAIVAKTIA